MRIYTRNRRWPCRGCSRLEAMNNKLTQRSLRQPLLDKRAMVQVLLIEDEASYAGLVSVLLSANPEQDCETTIASTLA